jgi:hypothetical protein
VSFAAQAVQARVIIVHRAAAHGQAGSGR